MGAHEKGLVSWASKGKGRAYLKLKGLKLGFLLNFGSNLTKEGIERVVNGLPEETLGLFAALRDTHIEAEPDAAPNAAPQSSANGRPWLAHPDAQSKQAGQRPRLLLVANC
jgi:hypothetical protein